MLCTGNLVESDVPRYIAAAESGFRFQPLAQQDRPLRSAVKPDITLQGCGHLYRRMDQNPASDNSAAQVCTLYYFLMIVLLVYATVDNAVALVLDC
jgi:hypothetical protein